MSIQNINFTVAHLSAIFTERLTNIDKLIRVREWGYRTFYLFNLLRICYEVLKMFQLWFYLKLNVFYSSQWKTLPTPLWLWTVILNISKGSYTYCLLAYPLSTQLGKLYWFVHIFTWFLLGSMPVDFSLLRLTVAYFSISGLEILDALGEVEEDLKKNICDWIYRLQILPGEGNTLWSFTFVKHYQVNIFNKFINMVHHQHPSLCHQCYY